MSHKVKMFIKKITQNVTSEISKTHKPNKYLYNMFVNHLGADFITRAIKGVFTVGMYSIPSSSWIIKTGYINNT